MVLRSRLPILRHPLRLTPAKQNLGRRQNSRRLIIEVMEDRRLLNVDWRNPVDSIDVNSNGSISPLDALLVINRLNSGQSRTLPNQHDPASPFFDTSGDGQVSPIDALLVINQLNSGARGTRVLSELSGKLDSETNVTITLGQTSGTRNYRVQLDSVFDTTDHSAALEDLLAVYLVDPAHPATTLLDRGTNGTALFTLAGTKAEFVPGRVTWDGSVLAINLSDLALSDTGLLKFQLLNSDSDSQTKVTIVPLTNQIDIEDTNGPKLSFDSSPVAAGASTTLANLAPMSNGQLQVGNVRYDSSTGKYNAEIRLRNDGDSLGRDVAIVFPGLPAGVTLHSPSGTTTAGEPYINLKPAIQRGGLTHGSWSEPVAVEFNNPGQALFVLKPKILAATNHAPTLAAIAPLTVMPGGVLNVSLVASDQDGDPITYSLVTTAGTALLPTGAVGSSGVLTFRPTPSQLGAFQFDVIASDGALEATRSVTLNVVADPITTTRVSGKVLRVNGQPLASMPVQIGAIQGLTLADGSFTLDLGSGQVVSDTVKVRGELFSGPLVYPFIAEKTAFILQHDVFAHFNNVIDRPIYLPELDVAGGTTIDPMHDVSVRQQVAPGETAEIFVAAGTLTNLQGTPFTGTLSITEVPIGLTPAALPFGMSPGLIVTIQPGEMVFARPAPLSLPNRGGWAPGTVMDLWSINPVTGQFDDVGDGQVSEDGKTVETISGGVRNSSWHFFAPLPIVSPNHSPSYNPKQGCNVCELKKEFNSIVELHSGTVIESHDLVSYQSQGETRGMRLVFDSLRADPRPIVHFGIDNFPSGGLVPIQFQANLRLVARMFVERDSFSMTVPGRHDLPAINGVAGDTSGNVFGGDENFWSFRDEPGSADAALQVDLRNQPSGVYHYGLDSGVYFYGPSAVGDFFGASNRKTGDLVVVNSIASPFGAGWGIAGLQFLVENHDKSVLLVDGDGSELLFTFNQQTSSYSSPVGDFSKFEKIGDGTFRRTLPDQTVYRFDSRANLASITDRNGNLNQINYDAQGRPTGMIDPTGLATTFTYIGNRVSKITDPAGRSTQLSYDGTGNLLRVTDPDSAARNWNYDSSHHMVGETDQLGRQEQSSYGFHGRATGSIRKDGSQIQLQVPETRGLYQPDATIDYRNPVPVFSLPKQAEATYIDANGEVQRSMLDAPGQPISQTDSIGSAPSVTRNADNLPITTTNARGSVTFNSFDAHGNLLSTQDSLSVRLGDDPSIIGTLSGDLQRQDQTDHFSFVAKAGERVSIDYIRGSASITIRTPSGVLFYDYLNSLLPEDGTYQVLVTGRVNAYVAAIRSLTHADELALGTQVTGNVIAGEDLVYRFSAQANQRFQLRDTANNPFTHWTLQGSTDGNLPLERLTVDADYYFLIPRSGEYYLTLVADAPTDLNLQAHDFTARLVDPTPFTKSGFDAMHSGTLHQGEEQRFSISGPQGLFIYFDKLEGHDAGILVELHDEADHIIKAFDDRSGLPFSLPASGTFQIVVRYNNIGSASADYSFRVLDLALAPMATFDSVINGTLTGGRAAIYKLAGSAGERYLLERKTLDLNGDLNLYFLLASGRGYQKSFAVGGISTLPDTGDFYLIVENRNIEPLDFSINSVDLRRMPSIEFEEKITGTFPVGSATEKYFRFHAKLGSSVYLEKLSLEPQTFDVIFEGGRDVPDDADNQFVTLTDRGDNHDEYVVIAKADPSFFPLAFGFRLHGPKESTKAIVLGQSVTGRIELNEVDTYTLDGVKGTSLYLDWRTIEAQPPAGFQWQLIGPNEQVIHSQSDPSTDYGPFILPATGTYRLSLSNKAINPPTLPRDYVFRLFDATAAPLVSLNSPLARQLTNGSAVNLFQLSGSAGERLRFEQTSTTTKLQIYSPSGRLVLDSGTNSVQFTALSETGQYLVIVSGRDASAVTPVSYEWTVFTANDVPVASIGFGIVYQGSASEGDLVATFQGNAGSRIQFQAVPTTIDDVLRVFGPSGETVMQFGGFPSLGTSSINISQGEFILPRSGQYTIRLMGLSSPLTVPVQYQFSLWELSSLTKLDLGTTYSAPILSHDIRTPFKFEATADQQYLLNVILPDAHNNSSDDTNINFSIERPDGTSATFVSTGEFVASQSGTYVLRIADISGTDLPISVRLLSINSALKLPLETTLMGTNSQNYEAVVRRFDVAAGEKLLLHAESANWSIIDLAGQDDFGITWTRVETTPGTFISEGLVAFPKDGTYTFLRRGGFNVPLDFSMRMTRFDEPVLPVIGGHLSSTTYTYDSVFSQLTSLTDQQDRHTLLDIDPANGNVRTITHVVGQLGGGDDQVTSFTYVASGQVDTETDPLGHVTDYDYDSLGRLITLTSAKGTPLQTVRRYEYDSAGNVSALVDENGHRTVFAYDPRNRPISVTEPDPDAAGPLTPPVTLFTYDAAGNTKTETNPAGQVSRATYDAMNRVSTASDPGNNTTGYAYDKAGNLIRVTDPLGHGTQMSYDARNRMVSSADAAGNATRFRYDADNNLVAVTDASGNSTTYTYDSRNRRVSETDPLGKTTVYVYNGTNQVALIKDRLGRTTKLDYDDLGQLITEHWLDATGNEVNTVHYSYDLASRLLRVQDNSSDSQFTFDALDRITSELDAGINGAPTTKLDNAFDSVGNLLTMTDTINGTADATNSYSYDGLNRATRIVQSGASVSSKRVDLQYNSLGQLTSLARFADTAGLVGVASSTYTYDALSRLAEISHKNAANAVLDSFAYQYDFDSRISQVTDIDGITNYSYDTRDELAAATHADPSNPDETYTYDATGNRISSHLHGTGYVVGDGVAGTRDANRLTSDGTFNYSYDAEGNLVNRVDILSGAVREFAFDQRNRLIQVTDRPSASGAATQVVKYTYDVFNRRIAKDVDTTPADGQDGKVTYFINAGHDIIADLTDADGSGSAPAVVSMRYLHGPAVDQVLAQEDSAGQVLWDLTDDLGTVRDLVNNSGQVVNHLKYDSYGNLISQSNPVNSTRYLYTGREFDAETGLQYNRARYYDAAIARFINEDPLSFGGQDANLYRYVSNRVTSMRDPSGLFLGFGLTGAAGGALSSSGFGTKGEFQGGVGIYTGSEGLVFGAFEQRTYALTHAWLPEWFTNWIPNYQINNEGGLTCPPRPTPTDSQQFVGIAEGGSLVGSVFITNASSANDQNNANHNISLGIGWGLDISLQFSWGNGVIVASAGTGVGVNIEATYTTNNKSSSVDF